MSNIHRWLLGIVTATKLVIVDYPPITMTLLVPSSYLNFSTKLGIPLVGCVLRLMNKLLDIAKKDM